jgi:leader peptidase (prepilin peptidase)/N-methyltransferase
MKSMWGILAGGGVLFSISWVYEKLRGREGIGGGDVKLAAMLGAFFGWKGIFVILLLASLLGSVVGLLLLGLRRGNAQAAIPFGPFLAAGALLHLFAGNEIVRWYLSLTSKLY